MQKTCECGTAFDAKRAAAKYCSERCKKRAQRRPGGTERAPAKPAVPVTGELSISVLLELDAAGRADSAVGHAALALAARIDAAEGETGSALAAMVRELRATLAEALADGKREADPVDELRTRRDRKLSAG